MSAVKRIESTTPDAATLDLWRVAEIGDVNELASVLPRVRDINAQNEHGVTALMRAAQYGHVKLVRALLAGGADANIKRNDKFTALALAAFFGHTEIVRVLMEHGADLQASTRYDTSPHMWATARTFNEVVDQLAKPAPAAEPEPPKPPPPPAPAHTVVKTTEVRTLKDPPEIWDLVHEAPRGFNPRSAFLTRLKSFRTGLVFRLAALAVLIAGGVVGVMLFRGVQARNERSSSITAQQPPPAATMSSQTTTAAGANSQPAAANTESDLSVLPPAESGVSAGDQPVVTRKPRTRSRFELNRGEQNLTRQRATAETAQPVAVAPAKPTPEARADTPTKTKPAAPLSPQLIAPAKSATPKGKVIPWP